MLLVQLLCAGILMTASSAQNFTWTGLAADSSNQQPPARHSAAMGAYTASNEFYVFGGRGNKDNGTEVFSEIRYVYMYFHECHRSVSIRTPRSVSESHHVYIQVELCILKDFPILVMSFIL